MKRLAVKKNVECMACLECVRACSNAFYKEFNEDLSCIKIVANGSGATEAALESGLQALHYNQDGKVRNFLEK